MSELVEGRHYQTGEPIRITIDGERIRRIDPISVRDIDDLPFVAPGLFDLQINGHGGTWFNQPGLTAEQIVETLRPHFARGITRLCPTLITGSFEALESGFSAIRAACESETWVNQMVAGCHLEGPWISSEDGPRGAHPREHVRPAEWSEFERWQDASGNRIRLVTLAPECPGAVSFTRHAAANGVVISIGHTAANSEQVQAVVDAGARLSTHLGNGAHGTLRRHPNYLWDQLGDRRLFASIITDRHHLPAAVVRAIIDAKGPQRTIITCDAAGLAGCPPGKYQADSVDVEVLDDGRIVIAGQTQFLAGSGASTDECVVGAVELGGISLAQAIDMASANPARLLNQEEIRLQRGARADLFLFRSIPGETGLRVLATYLAGQCIYQKSR